MEGFLSRLLGVFLAFLMLIVAPLINVYGIQELEERVEILNDTTEFLDKATDKGSITDDDLNEFYLQIESHGMTLDVQVSRLVKVAALAPDGSISTSYIAADNMDSLNVRDIVQVEIKEISTTPYKKLLNIFLKVGQEGYSLDMAKMVK